MKILEQELWMKVNGGVSSDEYNPSEGNVWSGEEEDTDGDGLNGGCTPIKSPWG